MTWPDAEQRISSPQQLSAVLRQIKESVARGELRQIRPADAPFASGDVTEVPSDGPWPDYVEAHFEDGGGKRYRLTVETYHGAGGSWSRT